MSLGLTGMNKAEFEFHAAGEAYSAGHGTGF